MKIPGATTSDSEYVVYKYDPTQGATNPYAEKMPVIIVSIY